MDCVNHSGTNATAYCQNCGKALCAGCARSAPGGQLLCEPCATAWQTFQPAFIPPPATGPNPSAAAMLGLIPGVGAMYNGQFFKAFIHVVVFAVLISITDHYPIFGLFIAAWVLYQSFEAFHTAKALRDGLPVPDPFGLNELGNWLNLGSHPRNPGQPSANQPPAPYAAPGYPPSYTGQYQAPFIPPPPGFIDPAAPPPPVCCGRREPIGAIVLIALGVIFLLGQLDLFHGQFFKYAWPCLLIALGVWLVVRRMGDSEGGSK